MANTRENPYVGPRAFTIQDQRMFAGRDRDILALYRQVIADRIVLLFSPSGAGKSSLVNAGLLPRMLEKGFKVFPVVRVNHPLPKGFAEKGMANRYVISVLQSLEADRTTKRQNAVERLSDSEEAQTGDLGFSTEKLAGLTIDTYLTQRLCPDGASDDEDVVEPRSLLIFDQFEEILTIDPNDHKGKQQFFMQLGEALESSRRWALFVVREDYVAALDPYRRFLPTRLSQTYRLDLLDDQSAMEAIRKPASLKGMKYTDAAVGLLVDELRKVRIQTPSGDWEPEPQLGRYVEPVQLQVVCYRLWGKVDEDDTITEAEVSGLGSVDESLAGFYAEKVEETEENVGIPQKDIRTWFDTKLITPTNIRSQVMWEKNESGGLRNNAILYLEKTHLIRRESRRGTMWLELAHDRLIIPVRENNQQWFKENLMPLQRQAMLWAAEGEPERLLLRDAEFEEAKQWAEEQKAMNQELAPMEEKFLEACIALRDRLQAETNRKEAEALKGRNRILLIAAAIAIFFGIFAFNRAMFAIDQEMIAREQSNAAATSANEAALSAATAQAAQATAQVDAIRAKNNEVDAIQQKELTLASKLANQSIQVRDANYPRAILLALESLRLTRNLGLPDLPVSHDALRSAISERNGLLLSGPASTVGQVVFSPDERWMAAVEDTLEENDANEGNVHMWDLTSSDPAGSRVVLNDFDLIISSIAFSPDGNYLAGGSSDGLVVLWELPLSQRSAPSVVFDCGPDSANPTIDKLAFNPKDSRWLAIGRKDGGTYLLDVYSSFAGTESFCPSGFVPLSLSGIQQVTALAFSPDGKWLATGSRDGVVRWWNSETPRPNLSPQQKDDIKEPISALAFSPDSAYLAAGSTRINKAYIWNVNAPGNEPIDLGQDQYGIDSLAFSMDSTDDRFLVTGHEDGSVQLWEGSESSYSGEPNYLGQHEKAISVVAFSPDGRWLASGSQDRTVILWDWKTQERITFGGHSEAVSTVTFSPNSNWLAVGSEDRTIRLWNLNKDPYSLEPHILGDGNALLGIQSVVDQPFLTVDYETSLVSSWDLTELFPQSEELLTLEGMDLNSAVFTHNSKLLAVGNANGDIKVWSVDPLTELQDLNGPKNGIVELGFSPDGSWLAASSADEVILWQVDNMTLREFLRYPSSTSNEQAQMALRYSTNGHFLIIARPEETEETRESSLLGFDSLLVWDLKNAKTAPRIFQGNERGIGSWNISADDRWLAIGTIEGETAGKARVWDLTNPNSRPVVLDGHTGWVNTVEFSPDNRWLATGDDAGMLRLWKVSDLQTRPDYEFPAHNHWLNRLAFDPNGRWLVSLGEDATVAFLDLSRLEEGVEPQTFRGHDGPAWELSFSPDKRWLATSSDDGTVLLWNLDDPDNISSTALQAFRGAFLFLHSFSADGRFLMTNDQNGAWQLWHMKPDDLKQIACQIVERDLTKEEWNTYMPEGTDYRTTCADALLIPQTPSQTCSIGSDESVNVTIQNESDQAVDVYWINFDCEPILYESLAPGDSYTQQSYITHVWQFFDSNTDPTNDRPLKEYVVKEDGEVLTIP